MIELQTNFICMFNKKVSCLTWVNSYNPGFLHMVNYFPVNLYLHKFAATIREESTKLIIKNR